MDDPDLRRRLADFSLLDAPGHLLRRNHQRSYEIFARHVGDDVTRQQIALLIALAKKPGASQRDLVDATGIDKSTLKEMLGRMVAREWVTRERDPEDNRAWTMRITPGGEALLGERIAAVSAAQREILSPLSEADRRDFLRCLRVLIGHED
ncbi:MarR family winged helix-turn-helix transcriptional regulator [Sphingomonas oryzagri]|uniref:MarR family winged helix-turn-helix transcriptional regulator n=1 Tax=Sphingomonas oryzagri TaxID=3042314 RepID=A0ABT6N198_9SPHN|nr:MarR family winged helix-turn-helix transcriptional regulator [Sphingomonas oryzagri]MDH7639035.1 MarR family winged helix-turn-helix transcriptional regulator [Sphingomonas oryzagri]